MSSSRIRYSLSLHLNETYDDNTDKLNGKLFHNWLPLNLIHFAPDDEYTLHKCSLSSDLVEYE